MRKRCVILFIFICCSNYIYSQHCLTEELTDRMFDGFDELYIKEDPVFTFLKTDTIMIYEINYTFISNEVDLDNRCYNMSFFIVNYYKTNLQSQIKDQSYITFGIYYQGMRPSLFSKDAEEKFDIFNLINRSGDSLAFKLNNNEFVKLFKTKAVVQKYHCYSKEWYQYYFPLRKKKKKEFDYVEILKILERQEVKDFKRNRYKRVLLNCN